jgi:hypothetical protein
MPLDSTLKKWIEDRIITVDEELAFLQAYIGTLPVEVVAQRISKHELEKKHLEEWLDQQGIVKCPARF